MVLQLAPIWVAFIYRIRCGLNGRSYVGCSTQTKPHRRAAQHRWTARNESAWRGQILYKDMQALGEEHFIYGVIEWCDDSLRFEREKYWQDELNSFAPNGYNLSRLGAIPSKTNAWELRYSDGRTVRVDNLWQYAREHKLSTGNLYAVRLGERAQHKGIVSVIKLDSE